MQQWHIVIGERFVQCRNFRAIRQIEYPTSKLNTENFKHMVEFSEPELGYQMLQVYDLNK